MNKTMKMIKPFAMTTAMLASSTLPETDYAAWSNVTAYAVGNRVIKTSTHRVYECVQAGTNHDPETAGVSWWVDIGPTNRWAMFDNVVGTSSSSASTMTIVLQPGGISGLALLELAGQSVSVTMRDAPAGTVVYSRTVTLDESDITSFYDWFYAPYDQKTDIVLTDLPPHFMGCELTITITSVGATSCGVCKFGEVIAIGDAKVGVGLEILDYSKKVKDPDFGTFSVSERGYAKLMTLDVITDKNDFARIVKRSAEIRATLCIYIATDADQVLSPLIVYGFYRSLRIVVEYPLHHQCALQIEGLI